MNVTENEFDLSFQLFTIANDLSIPSLAYALALSAALRLACRGTCSRAWHPTKKLGQYQFDSSYTAFTQFTHAKIINWSSVEASFLKQPYSLRCSLRPLMIRAVQ